MSTNQTQIDRLKNQHHERVAQDFNEVFGTPTEVCCKISWIWPSPVVFPETLKDQIFGYTLPTREDSELAPLTARNESAGKLNAFIV